MILAIEVVLYDTLNFTEWQHLVVQFSSQDMETNAHVRRLASAKRFFSLSLDACGLSAFVWRPLDVGSKGKGMASGDSLPCGCGRSFPSPGGGLSAWLGERRAGEVPLLR